MTGPGLRERKKARTRQVIADAAARLFAQRGYEQVAVSDVAREAEVSEQTVYNYFQTKEQLVTDRDQLVQDELSRLIRTRAPGTTPAAAIREFVLDTVEGIRRIPAGSGAASSASWPPSAPPSTGSPWRCQTARPPPSPPPSPRPTQ
jgi:Transcriptional regulator